MAQTLVGPMASLRVVGVAGAEGAAGSLQRSSLNAGPSNVALAPSLSNSAPLSLCSAPRQLLGVAARPTRTAPPRATEEGFDLSGPAAGEAPEESEEDITAAYEQMYGKPGASQRTAAGAAGEEEEEEVEEAPTARARSGGGGRREGGRGGRGPSEFNERVLQVRHSVIALGARSGSLRRSAAPEPVHTQSCFSIKACSIPSRPFEVEILPANGRSL